MNYNYNFFCSFIFLVQKCEVDFTTSPQPDLDSTISFDDSGNESDMSIMSGPLFVEDTSSESSEINETSNDDNDDNHIENN